MTRPKARARRILRRVAIGFVAALTGLAVAMTAVERGRAPAVMGEVIPADEGAYTAAIIASAIESVNYPADPGRPAPHPPYRRDVHAKAHGCVQALVDVVKDLAPALRQGVFAQPGRQYRAWIRFSSGNTRPQPDSARDARGFALKLTGVPGPKLLEPEETADTQDFVLINSPVFFIRNVEEYAKFARILADGSRLGYFFNQYSWNPLTWRVRDMILALKTLKPAPASLLHTRFFSLSAYKFGPDMNVKVSAAPCTRQPVATVNRTDPNFLRAEMKAELAKDEACFSLMVQPQVPGKNMPIEDPTVEWSERDSPFVTVATITVPKQDFDSERQNTFCENLSFSPWHALDAHRPIGGLNRLRKAVYLEDARYRRSKTMETSSDPNLAQREPKGWCLDLTGATCRD
jgi:catalase